MASLSVKQNKPARPLYSNHDTYWKAYNTYLENTNRHEVLGKWTEEEFDICVVKVLSGRLGDQPLHMLGVGSSEGHYEILQQKKLKTKFTKISATVIEPSKPRISEYQEKVNKKSSDCSGIDYEWHNQTFQEYMGSIGTEKKYHFISVVHSIYYVGDVEEAVRSLYELLEPGGMMLMIIGSDHTGVTNITKTFPNLALETKTSKSNESLVVKTNYIINSAVVLPILIKHQMPFTQSSYRESTDVTGFFTQEEMTTEAKLLLDVITLTNDLKESVPDKVFNQVMDFIKRSTQVKKSSGGDEKRYFDSVCDIVVISK